MLQVQACKQQIFEQNSKPHGVAGRAQVCKYDIAFREDMDPT